MAKVSTWLATPFGETGALFSPDGRWVAYVSDETGQPEIYVQHFDRSGDRLLVSNGGAQTPVSRADGKELYYATLKDRLVAVPVRAGARFEVGPPQTLFEARLRSQIGVRGYAQYDITPDGQRFLLNRLLPDERSAALTVVVDWAAGLGR